MAEEPQPQKRVVRRKRDGQLGEIIDRHGREWVKLDRPQEEILVPYTGPEDWPAEKEERPLTKAQVRRIAFDADRALCRAQGDYITSRKQWESLSDGDRMEWLEKGPSDVGRRRQLWGAILALFPEAR